MDDKSIILKKLYDLDERLAKLEKEVYSSKNLNEDSKTSILNSVEAVSKGPITIGTSLEQKIEKPTKNKVNPTKDTKFITPYKIPGNPKKMKTSSLEMELGGKWINRMGVIALIFGITFFLKYSFENNLIGPQGRILIGVLFGVSMLVSGDFLFKRYRIPSEGLMGGGIAALCFTVFAAFSFYGLIGQNTAFILFILIVGVSTFLAIKNDTVTIMHLGVLSGFLAPFLVSSGEPNDIFFLTYLVILNLGIMIISYYKSWKSLFNVAFVASHFCFLIWSFDRFVLYEAGVERIQFFTGFIPITIIFFEFLIVSILMNISPTRKKSYIKLDFFLLFMNAMVYYAECYNMLSTYNDNLLGIFTIIAAIVYLGIFFIIRKYKDVDKKFLISLLLVALIFITIAIPVQLDGRFISLAWAIEALVLSYLFAKTEYEKIKFAYISVTGIGLISLFVDLIYIGEETSKIPFFNINSIVYVLSIGILFGLLWIIKENKSKANRILTIVLTVLLNLLLIGFFLMDTSNVLDRLIQTARSLEKYEKVNNYMYMRDLVQSLVILLYSIILIFIGFVKNSKNIRIFSLSLFLLAIFKVFLNDLSSLAGIYRILSFVALGVILIGISFIYQKYKNLILGEKIDEYKKDI